MRVLPHDIPNILARLVSDAVHMLMNDIKPADELILKGWGTNLVGIEKRRVEGGVYLVTQSETFQTTNAEAGHEQLLSLMLDNARQLQSLFATYSNVLDSAESQPAQLDHDAVASPARDDDDDELETSKKRKLSSAFAGTDMVETQGEAKKMRALLEESPSASLESPELLKAAKRSTFAITGKKVDQKGDEKEPGHLVGSSKVARATGSTARRNRSTAQSATRSSTRRTKTMSAAQKEAFMSSSDSSTDATPERYGHPSQKF